MGQPVSTTDILSLLSPSIDTAKAYQRALSAERARYYQIYRAMPYGNEVDGWSKVVHPTAFTAVEWAKPGLLEIFIGDFFTFSPIRKETGTQGPPQPPVAPGPGMGMPPGPQNAHGGPPSPNFVTKPPDPLAKSAERLKKYIRHKFYNQLDGEQILDDGIHEALTSHYGIAKVTQREDYDLEIEPVDRISNAELLGIMKTPEFVDLRGGTTVQEHNPATGETWEGVEGAEIVRKKFKYVGFYIEIVPPEELYFLPGYSTLEKNPFVAHVVRRDLDYVKRQEMAGVYLSGSTELVRGKINDRYPVETEYEQQTKDEADNLSMPVAYGDATSTRPERLPANEVLIWECYCRLDIRGDGLLRPCIVTICENEVLRDPIENPYGSPPFELGYIYKEPNKIIGRPVPSMLEEQQKVMTNLTRGVQDSAGRSTYGGWLSSDPKACAALRDFAPGHVAYVPDVSKVQELQTHTPSDFIFKARQFSAQEISKESGVNENQMGLDNNSLNHTAAGMNMRMTAGMQRQKLYARRMARWWKRILQRVLDVIRLYPPQDAVDMVGADIMIQPEDLQAQYTVDIEVGVGPQDRQVQAAMMREYLQLLVTQLLPAGLAQPQHLLDAVDAMFEYQDMDVSPYHLDTEEIDPWKQMMGKVQSMQQQIGQMQHAIQSGQGMSNPADMARIQLEAQDMQHRQGMEEQRLGLERDVQMRNLDIQEQKIVIDAGLKRQMQPTKPEWPQQQPIPVVKVGADAIPVDQGGVGR